jgi:O-antigen ligase
MAVATAQGFFPMDNPTARATLSPSAATASAGGPKRYARLLGRVVFCSLLILIALVAIPYGTVEPWWQALFECAVFGLAMLWIVEAFLSGSWQLNSYRLLWPLLALVAFALLQTLLTGAAAQAPLNIDGAWRTLSADPHGTRRWITKVLALILVGAMLLRYVCDERRLRLLINAVVGVALLSAVFGLLRQMMQHQAGFALPYLKPGFGYAQFINKNHFPFLMEMALGLLLGLALGGGVKRERLLIYAAAALLLAGALVSANSRGGVLSLLCQLLFAALLLPFVRRARDDERASNLLGRARRAAGSIVARVLLSLCLLAVLVVGIVWVGGDAFVGSLEALPTEVGAPVEGIRWSVRRRDIWPATWQLIKEHPLAGVGFGGYWMAITEYHQASGEKTPQEAHNDYLEFLASGGLVALVLGAWFLYALATRARRQLRAREAYGRAACFGALVGLSGIAAHSLVDFGLHVTLNAVVFIALLVIATAELSSRRQAGET